MNIESATESLRMRTVTEPTQQHSKVLTVPHLNVWLNLNRSVNTFATEQGEHIKAVLADRRLSDQGKQNKLRELAEQIVKATPAVLKKLLEHIDAAAKRLQDVMLYPITAPVTGDTLVAFFSQQEIRQGIAKADADKLFLLALETGNMEVAGALIKAPGGSWVQKDIRRRGEEAYAQRTNPAAWEEAQSLAQLQALVESLIAQVGRWYEILGAPPELIANAVGRLSPEEVEDIERRVDKAFLKVTGRTWREVETDSLDKIRGDFSSLFGAA